MSQITHEGTGPSPDDWLALHDHSQLEHITDESVRRAREVDAGTMAVRVLEQIEDSAEQARWDNFHAGRRLHDPRGFTSVQK